MAIEELTTHCWPYEDMGFAALRVPLAELAARFQLTIRSSDGNGLGPERYVGFRTSRGRVYELIEYQPVSIPNHQPGPWVVLDVVELWEIGPEAIVAELIEELGITRADFVSLPDEQMLAAVAKHAESCVQRRSGKRKPVELPEISFDLVMDDDMSFVEGTYRLPGKEWQVFIISKHDYVLTEYRYERWESGVCGHVIRVPRAFQLNRESVLELVGDATIVSEWKEVRGPDSMTLR